MKVVRRHLGHLTWKQPSSGSPLAMGPLIFNLSVHRGQAGLSPVLSVSRIAFISERENLTGVWNLCGMSGPATVFLIAKVALRTAAS